MNLKESGKRLLTMETTREIERKKENIVVKKYRKREKKKKIEKIGEKGQKK